MKGEYQGDALITKNETQQTSTTRGWGSSTTLSLLVQQPEMTRGLLSAARIYFYGKKGVVNGTDVQALEVFNLTREGLTFGPTIAEMLQSFSSSTSSAFGHARSETQSGQEVEARPCLNIGMLHTEQSPTTFINTDWINKPEIRGKYEEQIRELKKWQTSTSSASGLYDPNISAVVSLAVSIGVGYMTISTGKLFASLAKLGLTQCLGILGTQMAAAGARAVLIGITSQAVMGLAKGNDPVTVAKELAAKESIRSLAINAVAVSALHGVNDVLKIKASPTALGDQIEKQAVKAGIDFAASLVRGHDMADALRSAAITTAAGVAANQIGGAYKGENAPLDYVTHKLCHGVLGGIMGALIADDAKRGAISGAISAIAAEILGEMIHTHFNDIGQKAYDDAETTGEVLSDDEYEKRIQEQAFQEGEIAKLGAAFVALLASQNVEVSLKTATNAIENNYLATAVRYAARSLKYIVEMAKKGAQSYQTRHFLKRDWHKELGIPKDWKQTLSKKQDGIRYRLPGEKAKDCHEIRIMRGQPKSDFPAQRMNYIKLNKKGTFYDIEGKIVDSADAAAHIPLKGNEKIIENLIKQLWP